jgi:hypothetical protein
MMEEGISLITYLNSITNWIGEKMDMFTVKLPVILKAFG